MKTLIIVFLALSTQAFAYSKSGQRKILNPDKALEQAQKDGLGLSKNEQVVKLELEILKRQKNEEFKSRIDNNLANPDFYQSYLYEVRDGRDKIEKAKVLAKATLAEAVRSNWSDLRPSILNRHYEEEFEKFAVEMKKSLNERTVYLPSKSKKGDMTFQTADWGRVTIASNMKTARWDLDVSSFLDNNPLEPGVEKIRVQDDDSGPAFEPEEREEEPVSAPALAGQDRKKVVPQLRKSRPGR